MTVALNPRLTFDMFEVGPSNQVAASAAQSVAATPGSVYNPLFIYSAAGLGKTHLLMAIGQRAIEVAPSLRVEYLTIDDFAEAFQAATAAGQAEAVRNRLAESHLLLVDDVHLLANRRDIQAELLRAVGVREASSQAVFAGNKPPGEIDGLEHELEQWFGSGLVVDITPPEYDTRLTILQGRAGERDAQFRASVLEAVAQFDIGNVRELLGVVNRLVALQAVSETPLTPEAACALLEGEALTPAPRPSTPTEAPAPPDEFSAFLSGVSVTVSQQVEGWEARLTDAIKKWQQQGYSTKRLEDVLEQDAPVSAQRAVKLFEQDIEELDQLQARLRSAHPKSAQDPVFRDPDRVREARMLVERFASETEPPPAPTAAWTLDNYVEGEANSDAVHAARAVAVLPAQFNPLVLIGPSGVGKTHLLHAVGNALLEARVVVACLSAQDLDADVLKRIDRAGALLLDDLQLLAANDEIQRRLVALADRFLKSERQLVFSISAPTGEIEGLSSDLVARLEAGHAARLSQPDRQLRHGLVARMLAEELGTADAELTDYLADRPADSVRAVVGLVQRVFSSAESQGAKPSASFAREMIEGALPRQRLTSARMRTSGVLISPSGGVRSREKMIWSWPDPADRLIEDLA